MRFIKSELYFPIIIGVHLVLWVVDQRLSKVLTDLGVERIAGLYDQVHIFGAGADWS